jgi:hypothetical protein
VESPLILRSEPVSVELDSCGFLQTPICEMLYCLQPYFGMYGFGGLIAAMHLGGYVIKQMDFIECWFSYHAFPVPCYS